MAAPNVVGVATITGVTTAFNHTTDNPITVVSNGAGTNRVLKINNITLANTGTTVGLATVKYHLNTGTIGAAPGAGTSIALVQQIGIATGTSIVVTDRASAFYLQEGECLSVQPLTANWLNTVISYEIIQ